LHAVERKRVRPPSFYINFEKRLINNKTMKYEIARLLFKTKEVVILDTKNYIEVQPGIMSPMIINIKNTLKDLEVRRRLAGELAKRVSPESICICGIESGGSYYAAAVADILKKPLILYRKEPKTYGIGGHFVGSLPKIKGGLVTMIDDILAGGMISTVNNKALSRQGYRSELVVIFSYLPKLVGPMARVRISPLTDINALCETGLESKVFNKNDVKIIRKECIWSNK
jgi:orotate phosphoribosyltransferase